MTSRDFLAAIGAICVLRIAYVEVRSVIRGHRAHLAAYRLARSYWGRDTAFPVTRIRVSRPTLLYILGSALIIYGAFSLAYAAVAGADCGEERSAVKLGLDREARAVPLLPVDTTIAELALRTKPRQPGNRRVADERTVYRIQATITGYRLEGDGDYHVVIADKHGQTMIVELPDPGCAALGAWASEIRDVRAAFRRGLADRGLGSPSKKMRTVEIGVMVVGVGLFDRVHGQDGVARNGIELHPVLGVEFGGAR